MDVDLRAMLRQEVLIARRTGANVLNEPTYGVATAYAAMVVERIKRVRTISGEEKVSTATVYVDSDGQITPLDRITLPDGTSPPILAVGSYPDPETGRAYIQEVYL